MESKTEHQRLLDAVEALINAVHPNFAGDMPDALLAMAGVVTKLDDADPTIMDLCAAMDGIE